MDQNQADHFIERYLSMWHEPDAARREQLVRSLWAKDAENFTREFVVRGLDEILPRVTRAHELWVAEKGFRFRPAGNTSTHHDLIRFSWEMISAADGVLQGRGLDVFVLTGDGRIRSLYQFAEPALK